MLIEDFPNSRASFHGFSLFNHQQPILYPITPPHHHSPPYQDFRGQNDIKHRKHMTHPDDGSYNLQKLHYYASLTPSTYYPTLYPSPPQSISPPSQTLQQLISYRKHSNVNYESGSGSEYVLSNDNDNRRNSVIMKVQDQMIVPSFKFGTPTAKIASDSDEENFVCKWISCFR